MGRCTREVDLAARPQTRESKKCRIPLSQTFLEPREIIDKYCISLGLRSKHFVEFTLSKTIHFDKATNTHGESSQITRRASLYDRKTFKPNERAVSNCDPKVLGWCRHCSDVWVRRENQAWCSLSLSRSSSPSLSPSPPPLRLPHQPSLLELVS
jgi:hypothetical protein